MDKNNSNKNKIGSYINFGSNLKKALSRRDMTQIELSEILGVDKTHVNKWATNKVRPSAENLSRIAEALGYDVEELVTGTFAIQNQRKRYELTESLIERELSNIKSIIKDIRDLPEEEVDPTIDYVMERIQILSK